MYKRFDEEDTTTYGTSADVVSLMLIVSRIAASIAFFQVSLYPAVMKQETYPIGPVKVVRTATVDSFKDDDGNWAMPFYGLVKVKVVATQRLKHGVLPYRTKEGRLDFPLCGKLR